MNAAPASRAEWIPIAEIRRVRPLGEDFALPRVLYFTQIPLLLCFAGIVCWVIGTEYSTVAASLVGGLVGLGMLWDWLLRGGATRFSTTISIGLLLGYGLGAFNTWATTPRGDLSLGEYTGYDDAVLARGMAAVLFSCAITIFFGELFERPIVGRDFRLHLDQRIYLFIYIWTGVILAAFASGGLSLSGAADVTNGQIGVLKSALLWIFPPLTAVAVTVFLITPPGSLNKLLMRIVAPVLMVLIVILGRRTMVYTIIDTVFLARIAGFRLKGAFHKKILVFILVGVFIVGGALGFMLLRIAGYGSTGGKSLPERFAIAGNWISEGTALQKTLDASSSNVQTRTFVLGFFSAVLDGSSTHTPGLGENAVGLLQLAVPSIIYPDKDKFYSEEALTDRLFGFSYGDQANSLLTNGATDFGFLGAMVYPLLIAFILRGVIEFCTHYLDQVSSLLFVLSALFLSLQAENSLTAYAELLIQGFVFTAGFMLYFALPRFQLRK